MAQRSVRYLELQILADTRGMRGPLAAGGQHVRQFATEADRAAGATARMGRGARTAGGDARGFGAGVRGLSGDVGNLAVRVAEANTSFSDFSRGGGAVVATAGAVGAAFAGMSGIKFDANMEQLQIGFEDLLGSGEAAEKMLDRLYRLASETPFEFQDVTAAERKLVGLGVEASTAYDWLTKIGDAVAGVGGGSEELERVTRAVAQIQAKGKLSMEELNQLGEAGIPAQEIIRKELRMDKTAFGKTFTAGHQIKADPALDALFDGLEKRYKGMAARQASTFNGQVDKLKDQSRQAAGAAMEPVFEAAKTMLPVLSDEVTKAAPKIAKATAAITSELQDMAEDGSIEAGLEDIGTAVSTVGTVVGAAAKIALGALHTFEQLPDPVRSGAIAFGLMYLAGGKLAKTFGLVGREAAIASAEVAGLQATAARGVASSTSPSRPKPGTVPVYDGKGTASARVFVPASVARKDGATGFGALSGRSYTVGQVDGIAQSAQRQQTEALRRTVAARSEVARLAGLQAAAERTAAAMDERNRAARTAGSREQAAATAKMAAAAREESAAAAARTAAARAELVAARARLAGARSAQAAAVTAAAEARAAAAVPVTNPRGMTDAQIRRQQALNEHGTGVKGQAKGAAAWIGPLPTAGVTPGKVAGAAAAGGVGALMSDDPAQAALMAGGLGLIGGLPVAFGAAGAAALGTQIKKWIEDHGKAEGERLGRTMAPGFSKEWQATVATSVESRRENKRKARTAERGVDPDDNFLDGALRSLGLQGPSRPAPGDAAKYRAKALADDLALAKRSMEEFQAEAKKFNGRRLNTSFVTDDVLGRLKALGPEGRVEFGQAAVEWARTLESQGKLPKGAADRLAKSIVKSASVLPGALRGEGAEALKGLAAGLKGPAALDTARDLVRKMDQAWGDMPGHARLTGENTAHALDMAIRSLRARLPKLTGPAKEQAEKDIAQMEAAAARLKDTAAADLAVFGERLADALSGITGKATTAKDAVLTFATGAANAAPLVQPLVQMLSGDGNVSDLVGLINGAQAAGKSLRRKRTGGWNRYADGGTVPTLMSGGEQVLEPHDVASWESRIPGALSWIEANQPSHFAKGGSVQRKNLGGWTVPGPSDRDGTFVPATPGSFVLTGGGQQMLADLAGAHGYNTGGVVTGSTKGSRFTGKGSFKIGLGTATTLAKAAGFRGQNAATATAIAGGESNLDAFARNGHYIGLMQVGDATVHRRFAKRNLWDPLQNMQSAHDLWLSGGWKPWEAWTNGSFRKYLPQAQRALNLSTSSADAETLKRFKKKGRGGVGSDSSDAPTSRLEEKTVKAKRSASIGYSVYDDMGKGAFGLGLSGGYAELGTATRAGKGTGVGWIARALGLKGELPANTPLSVTINGKTKTLTKRDRGYGQGGDGKTSSKAYGLDVWKDSWRYFGLNANSKGRANVTLGAGSKLGAGHEGATIRTPIMLGRSKTRAGLMDDPLRTGYDAGVAGFSRTGLNGALRQRNPVTTAVRQALDAQASSYTRDVTKDSRTRKVRVYSDDSSGADGELVGRGSSIIGRAKKLGTPGLMGAKAGMRSYARMGAVFGLGVTSGSRPGAITSSGKPSQHGAGDAVDISGGPKNMLRFAKWLGSSGVARRADQVIHTPLGYGWSGGKKVGLGYFGKKVNADHYDHVHIGDSTPPKLRRGGAVRRFAVGGSVGKSSIGAGLSRSFPTAPAATKAMGSALSTVKRGVTDAAVAKMDAALAAASTQRVEAFASDLLRQIRKGGDKQAVARLQAAYDSAMGEVGIRIGQRVKAASDALAAVDSAQSTREARFAVNKGLPAGSSAAMAAGIAEDQSFLAKGGGYDVAAKKLDRALKIALRNGRDGEAAEIQQQQADLDDRKLSTRYGIQQARQELPRQQVNEVLGAYDFRGNIAGLTTSVADDRQNWQDRKGFVESAYQQALGRDDQDTANQLVQELGNLTQQLKDTEFTDARGAVSDTLKEYDYQAAMAGLTADTSDDAAVAARRQQYVQAALDDANARNDHEAATDLARELVSLNSTIKEEQDRQTALTDVMREVADNQGRLINLTASEQAALTAGFAALVNGSIGGLAQQGLNTSFVPGQKARY